MSVPHRVGVKDLVTGEAVGRWWEPRGRSLISEDSEAVVYEIWVSFPCYFLDAV